MKSQYLSILPGITGENSELENFGGEDASYPARYQAFLDQQSQRNQRANHQGGLNVLRSLVRGLINLVLFVTFFLGFLTLFGFGLSRLSGNSSLVQSKVSASTPNLTNGAAKTPAPASLRKRVSSQ